MTPQVPFATRPAGRGSSRGPRAVTYPYRRIERPAPTLSDGPDPYGNPDPEWLRIDWREHTRWVDLAGTRVSYAEIGSGPPLLFIHGLGGSWQNWLENLPPLAAAGYRAIALDLPGFGHSPMPDFDVSMPAYGRLVDDFCAALGLAGATIVGNSMGGFIAAEVALSEPEWIERLVLVSAAGISHATMRKEPVAAGAHLMVALTPLAVRMNLLGLRRPRLRRAAFQSVMRHPELIRPELLWELFVHTMGSPAFRQSMVALTGYDFLDRLERLAVPTLLVWGRDDLVVPAADASGYAERISDSELHIFADTGHVPMVERPVRFNRLLGRFIDGAGALSR
jgi:pimeloyl-ACP methyl ester carboxylesterase